MRNKNKRKQQIAIAALIILIVAIIPIYYYISTQSEPHLSLEVKGNVFVPYNYTLSDYVLCPSFSVDTNLNSGNENFTYEGVSVAYLVSQSKCYDNIDSIIIQSVDGSAQTFTVDYVVEHANSMILAYKKDGQYLTTLNNDEGPLRLIITGQPAEKCLKNVVSIIVQ
jgi:hypothetical protein